MAKRATSKREGWSHISGPTKVHYYRDTRSLCGRWMSIGSMFELPDEPRSINCVACERIRVLERQNLRASA